MSDEDLAVRGRPAGLIDRKAAWNTLSVQQRDVVTFHGGLCKRAAREGDSQDAKELYLLQGKLLALEMLVGCISRCPTNPRISLSYKP
jgi:hypothetical protein